MGGGLTDRQLPGGRFLRRLRRSSRIVARMKQEGPIWFIDRLGPLLFIGILATTASGSLQSAYGVTPGGTFTWEYGFPLPWRTIVGVSCDSPLRPFGMFAASNAPCLKSLSTTTIGVSSQLTCCSTWLLGLGCFFPFEDSALPLRHLPA